MPVPVRARTFFYVDVDVDATAGTITCHFLSDDVPFTEVATFDSSVDLSRPGVEVAAELYFLFSGLSYYKAGAAPTIDLGERNSTDNAALVRAAVLDGLGEFAYRNDLDLSDVDVIGAPSRYQRPASISPTRGPLIPFGGGIDSIVTATRFHDDAALFIVGPTTERFDAIERPAAQTGLPVVRCARRLDDKILDSSRLGWFNGHVPVTAMLSALAIVAACGQNRRAVVMSNERSASSPNLVARGRAVNHQWSKSWAFEELCRRWLASRLEGDFRYYSALRDRSELWVAREFAALDGYVDTFMSCNRAFRQDPSQRATTWCGECDKCLFIDLVLAPFIDRTRLAALFADREPIADPGRVGELEVLVGLVDNAKPFECVGDTDECATALVATAARPDRLDESHLVTLAARCHAVPLDEALEPAGPTNAPERRATRDLV